MKLKIALFVHLYIFFILSVFAQDNIYKVDIEPLSNEKFKQAEYSIWIPENLDKIERIILHQHGCGNEAQLSGKTAVQDLHWRLLAERNNAALVGSSLWYRKECRDWCDPANGTERAFQLAMDKFSQMTDHPEIKNAKWVFWGHSGGGYWSQEMLKLHPDRIEAVVLQSAGFRSRDLRGSEMNVSLYPKDVPVLVHVGIKEKGHRQFSGTYDDGIVFFRAMRKHNARVTLAIDPKSGHGAGNGRYLSIPWVEAALNASDDDGVVRESDFSGNGNWFPDESLVAKQEVFSVRGNVADSTPPKRAPYGLSAEQTGLGVELSWKSVPDWESGIQTFRIYRDGEFYDTYTAPANTAAEYTSTFRKPNFFDTPPHSKNDMLFLDRNVQPEKKYSYQVKLVNWSSLESPLSEKLEFTTKSLE